MRVETENRLKRLDAAAQLLLQSTETAAVKTEVGIQISIYSTVLMQLQDLPEHTQEMNLVVAPIDEFCALTERSLGGRGN